METNLRQGQVQMLVIDSTIVVLGRKWRSKWWTIHCVGCNGRRRNDGSCKHEQHCGKVFEVELPQ